MSNSVIIVFSACLLLQMEGASTIDNQLLPEVFPTDPSGQLMPVFLQPPANAYASKSSPAVLTCVVAHATKAAHFVCHSDTVMKSTTDDQVVDEKTQLKARKLTLEVTRAQVLDGLGSFHCRCYAASAKGSHATHDVTVTPAYMRRDFETPPYSQQIAVGDQAQLRCHPPRAKPAARVTHWLKNGRPIKPSDTNFIQSADGHLLILQARMEDNANYSCVAANDANLEKTSDPATLTVFVPGQWGQWGPWSGCSKKCGVGIRKRTRTCDSPAPLNNGPGCKGVSVDPKSCNQICPPVNGEWAEWQSWSSCSPDCLQFRRRECSNPKPKNGGRYCQGGRDSDSRNCTGGMCKPDGLNTMVFYGSNDVVGSNRSGQSLGSGGGGGGGVPTTDLTLCIGLVVAFIIFLAVVLVIIKLLKKKGTGSQSHSGYTLTPPGEVLSSSGSSNNGGTIFPPHHSAAVGQRPGSSGNSRKKSLGYTPDVLTANENVFFDQYVPAASTVSNNSDRNSNCSNNKDLLLQKAAGALTADFRPISEHLYEQPMVVFPGGLKASTPIITTTDRTPFLSENESGLPQHIECMNWATVTPSGAKITLPGPGTQACLTVPQGAVVQGHRDMYVALVSQEEYRRTLRLDHLSQTAVTPIVQCGVLKRDGGGVGVGLVKPVVLSVPHFATAAPSGDLTVLYCSDLDSNHLEWQVLDCSKQVDSSTCHLVTERLGAYVLVSSDVSRSTSSGYNSLANSPLSEPVPSLPMPKLSATTRSAICRSLDVPTCQGADWRRLASVLGVEQYSSFFSTQASPSEALLDLWEAKTRTIHQSQMSSDNHHVNLRNFANLLREISREDVVVILERELK